MGRTALSAREVDRAGVLRRVKEGKLKLLNAARMLGIRIAKRSGFGSAIEWKEWLG